MFFFFRLFSDGWKQKLDAPNNIIKVDLINAATRKNFSPSTEETKTKGSIKSHDEMRTNYSCIYNWLRDGEWDQKKNKKKCPRWDEQAKFFLCLTFSYVNKYINFWEKVERNCSRHFLVIAHTAMPRVQKALVDFIVFFVFVWFFFFCCCHFL